MPLQNPNKIKKNPPGGPPRPGLIWNPSSHRWVRPRAGAPGQHSTINPKLLRSMSDKELEALKSHVRTNILNERNQERFNDLTRVMRQTVEEGKRRQVTKALDQATKLAKRLDVQGVLAGTTVLLKGLSIESAIPLEQIRGDLARAGHTVKSIIALDPESRRIFFMDTDNKPLYCSFAGPDSGFKVEKIGYQADIAKEYDPVDLEPDDTEEKVFTEHEERDGEYETPGLIPSGTPGEKPERDEQDHEDAGQFGEGLGDEGFGTEKRHEGRRDELKAIMGELEEQLKKAGPPRPGLVPESGDPQHPKHWVRPQSGPAGGAGFGDKPYSGPGNAAAQRQRERDARSATTPADEGSAAAREDNQINPGTHPLHGQRFHSESAAMSQLVGMGARAGAHPEHPGEMQYTHPEHGKFDIKTDYQTGQATIDHKGSPEEEQKMARRSNHRAKRPQR